MTHCAVLGCHNTWRRLNEWMERECFVHQPAKKRYCSCAPLFTFHHKPNNEEDSRMWLKALNLKNPPKRVSVCCHHFVDKKPTPANPYPELWLGYERPPQRKRRKLQRTTGCSVPVSEEKTDMCVIEAAPQTCSSEPTHRATQTQVEDPVLLDHNYCRQTTMVDKGTQCDREIDATVASTMLLNNDNSLLFTGMHRFQFFTFVSTLMPFSKPSFTLPVVDQVLMTLMKLKLNLVLDDIAQRFKVSRSMTSKVIAHWIDVMGEQCKILIPWLPKEVIRAAMPLAFKKNYPQTTCIIDCAESAIQRAKNLDSRSATFSHYKGTNTVKYLVAVSPSGMIMFISNAYVGKSSDKYITMDSGFLEYLRPGDEVMADRGFTIRDLLHERHVRLNIPAFTHKGGQLTNEEVTRTRRVANVRIHVERAIRRLKVFKILSQTVPISMTPRLDKILTICAALVNMRSALIKAPT